MCTEVKFSSDSKIIKSCECICIRACISNQKLKEKKRNDNGISNSSRSNSNNRSKFAAQLKTLKRASSVAYAYMHM